MLDGRFDPALALLLTGAEPDASDLPHPLVILSVAGVSVLAVALVCLGMMTV